jgi:NADPH:quinone reductase-like Zn-dependent oxidoreductase
MVEMPLVGSRMVKTPATPGKDFAGVVVKVPTNNTTGLKEGQRVCGRLAGQPQYGALGEYTLVNVGEDACVPLPEAVSYESGAAVGTAGIVALQSIKPYLPAEGGTVFINGGAAGTGTWGIQIAKALGAKNIVTTCSGPSIDLCTSLGATECIDYRKTDVLDILKKRGQIFDIAVDFIGTPTTLYKASHHFLKPDGQFVQIAATPNFVGIAGLLSAQYQPKLLGGGKRKYIFLRTQNVKEDFELVGRWLQDGQVKAIIDSTYEWKDAPEAYKKLKSGRAKGKIIVNGVGAE